MGGYGELGAVKIGDHAATPKKTSLVPGDYWLNVACSEGRNFGPVSLTRESRSVSSFRVVAP
jgi:hypothetical protein